jgi:hypothetical protein
MSTVLPRERGDGKIRGWHRDRLAVVYVRHSSRRQVLDHGESMRLQYGLTERAVALGWPASRVMVIDEDLGRSAANAACLFHVVQLAVKALGDVRRRATREKYGRRGKKGDPEYGLKGLLGHNLENLSPDKFAKVIDVLDADGHWQQVLLAWIAREKLRTALNVRARVTGSRPGTRPALRLLRLVRPERGRPRAAHPGRGRLALGRQDRHRRRDRRHQRVGFILRLSLVLMRCSRVVSGSRCPGSSFCCC